MKIVKRKRLTRYISRGISQEFSKAISAIRRAAPSKKVGRGLTSPIGHIDEIGWMGEVPEVGKPYRGGIFTGHYEEKSGQTFALVLAPRQSKGGDNERNR